MTYRLIFLTTNSLIAFLFWDRSKVPEKFIPLTLDHERMLNVLKGSDREWIAVMPPHIEGKYVINKQEREREIESNYFSYCT